MTAIPTTMNTSAMLKLGQWGNFEEVGDLAVGHALDDVAQAAADDEPAAYAGHEHALLHEHVEQHHRDER